MSDVAKGTERKLKVAIIGAGISGLYCAMKCAGSSEIGVFESSNYVGGRISSHRYEQKHQLEFVAEFGPMRIEPEQQELLAQLLEELGIRDEGHGGQDTVARLTNFPAYSSPPSLKEPSFLLSGDELAQADPMDLLQLAFVRILGRLTATAEAAAKEREALQACITAGQQELMLAAATRQPSWKGAFTRWVNGLTELDYHLLTAHAAVQYDDEKVGELIPLRLMGFWNLMSEVLSHQAVSKLRTQGSFYHLLDENPNAATWLVFWLRGLKTTNKLKGIDGGMDQIVEEMQSKLAKKGIEVECNASLIRLVPEGQFVRLKFKNSADVLARHVILCLPRAPLDKVAAASYPYFSSKILKAIDSVFAFPMIKLFFIVKKRWWQEDRAANYNATSIPTREVHYFVSRNPDSKKGMIMIYSDRPNTNFWANYVAIPGHQTTYQWSKVDWRGAGKATDDADDMIQRIQERRLVRRLAEYVRENARGSFHEDEIEEFGIRDWGREPYGGANHAWSRARAMEANAALERVQSG